MILLSQLQIQIHLHLQLHQILNRLACLVPVYVVVPVATVTPVYLVISTERKVNTITLDENTSNTVESSTQINCRDVCTTNQVIEQQQTSRSIHLRNDFAFHQSFNSILQLESLIKDETKNGILTSTYESFSPNKESIELCLSSMKMLKLPNAGGNSLWSEVISLEVLISVHKAKLLKTEMELEYWPLGCKITDYSIELFGDRVGVSVTRALKFGGIFTENDAQELLKKKLYGVNVSSKCVLRSHGWKKQILFVWAEQPYIGDLLLSAYHNLDNEFKSNTIVYLCVCKNAKYIF